MNGQTFKTQVGAVVAFLTLISGISLYASVYGPCSNDLRLALRAIPTALIPIGTAWLAYCWQRRSAFTKALLDLWHKTVSTIQDARQYTFLAAPSPTEYGEILSALSCRIDEFRGVFRNIGEDGDVLDVTQQDREFIVCLRMSETWEERRECIRNYKRSEERGLFPFEPIKQIHRVMSKLGYLQPDFNNNAASARRAIDDLWQILRKQLLRELDRDFPEHPNSPFQSYT